MEEAINIIGAGPAGLTAAIVLAMQRYKVKVHEMSPDVGHRFSGDFQGFENWSTEEDVTELLKDLGIEINFLCAPYYQGIAYAPEMKPVKVESERPIFYLVKRGSMPGTLDAGLKEQALSLGVEMLFNRRLDAFSGRAIVGTGPKGADALAVGITFNTETEDQVAVVLDDDIAPKGYAYLIVNQGCGTMVTAIFREYRRESECFHKMLEFFKRNMHIDMKNVTRFGGYGNFFLRSTQIFQGKLYIGESAGFQDFLWGFGMRYAILSGYFAAKHFMDGTDYDLLWRKELKPMIQTSLVNRWLFEKLGHTGYRYLARKAAQVNICNFLRKHYNYSVLKHLLLPLARRNHQSRVKDERCNHENCSCIWCRCGEKACP